MSLIRIDDLLVDVLTMASNPGDVNIYRACIKPYNKLAEYVISPLSLSLSVGPAIIGNGTMMVKFRYKDSGRQRLTLLAEDDLQGMREIFPYTILKTK
jgi:hypothetical protein